MNIATKETNGLAKRFSEFRKQNPTVRIRDAAEKLNVSEGELLATGIGESVVRLNGYIKELMHELYTLGRVMALTRNDEIVHERKGVYLNAQTKMPHGMVLFVNPDIDLRIFTGSWHHGFAATVENARGTLKSLQFFDEDGTAVHKIYLTQESDSAAYDRLVENFRDANQAPNFEATAKPVKPTELPDRDIDIEEFRASWKKMQDTHDFFPMLSEFKLTRKQALRLADQEFAREVPPDSFKFVLEEARDRRVPIMVFVGNDGIIQIHTGEVENVVEAKGWFNVMDESFNLHINQDQVGSAFVVRKPTQDGIVTSVELFNKSNKDIALFFGKRKPGIPEREDWRKLVADLETLTIDH